MSRPLAARLRSGLIIGFACGSMTCMEVGVKRFERFDIEAFVADFEFPDGALDGPVADSIAAIAHDTREVVQAMGVLAKSVREGATALREQQAAASSDEGFRASETVFGTNFFVRVACPGPDLSAPSSSGEHGTLVIEGPFVLRDIAPAGDVLLTLSDCRVGPFRLNGETPAWVSPYVSDEPEPEPGPEPIPGTEPIDPFFADLALRLDFEIENVETGKVREIDLPIYYGLDRVFVLLRLAGEAFILGFEGEQGFDLSIRGANTRFVCDLSSFPPACTLEP